MGYFKLDAEEFDRLQQSVKNFPGNAEKEINEVLHNEASSLIQNEIRRLMPVSGRKWRGKKAPAKTGNSLTDETGNLFVTVKNSKSYQYLYFPDDGSSTRRHAGNQQFFLRGGENKQTEIIDRCVKRLTRSFDEAK